MLYSWNVFQRGNYRTTFQWWFIKWTKEKDGGWMKVKKLLIGLLVSGLVLSCTGCGGDEVINDSGEKVSSYGQFIEIKRNHYTDSNTNATDQIFMYDKDTKIVYVYTERSYSTSTMTYYVLDENGKPEIAVYGENYNG